MERPLLVRLRPLESADRELLRAFPQRVSSETARARFHGALATLTDRMLDRLLDLEPGRHEAVIAEDEHGIAGVARYARDERNERVAEVAVIVADDVQHAGVGRALVSELIEYARRAGIERFRATVARDNSAALNLVTTLAPHASSRSDGATVVFVWLL